jgi:hypothetical protein
MSAREGSPHLSTAEAQLYLGYHTPGGIRMACLPRLAAPFRPWAALHLALHARSAGRIPAAARTCWLPLGCRPVRKGRETNHEAQEIGVDLRRKARATYAGREDTLMCHHVAVAATTRRTAAAVKYVPDPTFVC